MEITINTPSMARIEGNLDEISSLNKQLGFIRDSIRVLLGKHKSNRWFKSSNPDQWEWRLKELQSQLKGTCLYKDNKGHFIRPGTISYIENIDIKVQNNVLYPELKSFKWTKEPEFTPYPYQSASVEKLIAEKHGNVDLATGCHAANEKILMYDGSTKNSQDISVGDHLMGPDNKKRVVLNLVRGTDDMYKISPKRGDSFIVNSEHILSLKRTGIKKNPKYPSQDTKGIITNISVKDYLDKSKTFKHISKLYRCSVDSFHKEKEEILGIDPYMFGLWLGDGNSNDFTITNIDKEVVEEIEKFAKKENSFVRTYGIKYTISDYDKNKGRGTKGSVYNRYLKSINVYKNKHIPHIYKTTSVENRRKLLAGLLDSDGYMYHNMFEITQKSKKLTEDISFLCRSLGFSTDIKKKMKCATNTEKKTKHLYYSTSIVGDFTQIPTKIKRKQTATYTATKNPLVSGFNVENIGVGDYYGFTVDGDNLYVMGDFTVTHNCGKSLVLLLLTQKMGLKTVIITPSKSIFNELLTEFQIRLGKDRVGGYGDGKKDIKKPITIAIGKSLANLKEGTEAYDFFKNKEVIKIDESHSFAASQLESVCHGVLGDIPYRFFVSATQTRGDGTKKLLQSIIGKTVFEMSIKDAIDQKYLCPLKYLIIDTYSSSTSTKRDPIEAKRAHFLRNEFIAEKIAKLANAVCRTYNQSTLVLVEELRQISMLQDLIEVPFGYVHSGSKKDAAEWGLEKVKLQEQVDAFNRGDIKVLVGTRAIATGTNLFPTHFVAGWLGGKSEIITKQGPMGRSTRKLEISKYKDFHPPKPFTTVVDFRVLDNDIMERQLQKRLEYYAESGGDIRYV